MLAEGFSVYRFRVSRATVSDFALGSRRRGESFRDDRMSH